MNIFRKFCICFTRMLARTCDIFGICNYLKLFTQYQIHKGWLQYVEKFNMAKDLKTYAKETIPFMKNWLGINFPFGT